MAAQTVTLERIAEARILIDQSRLLTLKAAYMMDKVGNKLAAKEIAMIKVAAPNMACQVIDRVIQVHGGGGGVTDEFGSSYAYAQARTLRLADGPDEVDRNQIGTLETVLDRCCAPPPIRRSRMAAFSAWPAWYRDWAAVATKIYPE